VPPHLQPSGTSIRGRRRFVDLCRVAARPPCARAGVYQVASSESWRGRVQGPQAPRSSHSGMSSSGAVLLTSALLLPDAEARLPCPRYDRIGRCRPGAPGLHPPTTRLWNLNSRCEPWARITAERGQHIIDRRVAAGTRHAALPSPTQLLGTITKLPTATCGCYSLTPPSSRHMLINKSAKPSFKLSLS
jgi:hypothetical protein